MRKKILFHKTLSIILIVLFITLFTFSSVQAYSSYKYNDYMNIIFQDEQYFDRNTYKNFLNVFNSYTKGLNFNSDYNTIKKQMITKVLELRKNYPNSATVSNISNKLLNKIINDNSNNSQNLIQNILNEIISLFNSSIVMMVPDETVTINSTTATKLVGDKYNVELSANIYYANDLNSDGTPKSNKWVVLVHGFMMNGQAITDALGEMYLEQGYNILAPDLRGAGNTSGNNGMGYLESLDVFDWLTYLNNRYSNNCSQILVHGVSLGGATTLFLSGLEIDGKTIKDKNVIGLVDDCGYTSMTGIIKDLLNTIGDSELVSMILGIFDKDSLSDILTDEQIKEFLITTVGVGLTEENFDKKQDAINSLRKCEVPLLIIHGTNDTTVPFKNSDIVYNEAMKISSIPYVQRYIADGEPHAFIVVGNQYNVYEGHVHNFIKEAESIAAGNTSDKESNYEQEEEKQSSSWDNIIKTLVLFKDMLF